MKILRLELTKCKRTGILLLMIIVGILGFLYIHINFQVRKDTLLNLPLEPTDILLTQIYGMIMVLNMFGIIVVTCMIYHLEFKTSAIKIMYLLPIQIQTVHLYKFLIISTTFLFALCIQNLAFFQIGVNDLPPGSFNTIKAVTFAGYTYITSLPVLSFMLFVSSRFEQIWVTLGIGVAGFLTGMSFATSDANHFVLHPFVIMLSPAIAMSAEPDAVVIIISLSETILFLVNSLWLLHKKYYE